MIEKQTKSVCKNAILATTVKIDKTNCHARIMARNNNISQETKKIKPTEWWVEFSGDAKGLYSPSHYVGGDTPLHS